MEQFGQEARDDARLRKILDTVEVSTDEQHTNDYPRMRPARVFVRANGKEYVEEVSQPYGEPDNPMTDADLDAKFRRLTGPVVGEERAARIVEAAWALDDPARLFADLAGEPLAPAS
jgi:2-methylcitrate dehydratase PrpD